MKQVLRVVAFAVGVVVAWSAQAAPIGYNFEVDFTTGPLSGQHVPGTLSVDVSDDRRTLYIHTIDLGDREDLVGQIASGFETRVLRAVK